MPKRKSSHGGRRPGAGRKASGDKKPVGLRLSGDVREYLKSASNGTAVVEAAVRATIGYRLWHLERKGLLVRLDPNGPEPECV